MNQLHWQLIESKLAQILQSLFPPENFGDMDCLKQT